MPRQKRWHSKRTFKGNSQEYKDMVKMKEIEYFLHKNRAYRTVISSEGLAVRVGSKWTREVLGESVICTIQRTEVPYSFDYGTKFRLLMRTRSRNAYVKAVPRRDQSEYWKFIKQEVWMCENDNGITFLRIVNELKGLKELYEVEYYDGVQLYQRVLLNGGKSVNLVEIKYMDPNNFEVLKYVGELALKEIPPSTYNFIDCVNCDGQLIRKTEYDIFFEFGTLKDKFMIPQFTNGLKYILQPDRMNKVVIGGTGDTVMISLPFPANGIGHAHDIVSCDLLENYPYKPLRFYLMYTHSMQEIYDQNLKNYVDIQEQNIWFCSKSKDYRFYRMEFKIKVSKNLRSVYFKDGVTVMKQGSAETDYFVVGVDNFDPDDFKTVRYVISPQISIELFDNLMHSWKRLKLFLEGDVYLNKKLDNPNHMCGTVNMGGKYHKSHDTDTSDSLEILYSLDHERVYKIAFGKKDKGVTLRFGQKWTSVLGDSQFDVRCDRVRVPNLDAFIINYRSHCSSGNIHNDNSDLFQRYFTLQNWEVWICKGNMGETKIEFERVLTFFELSPQEPELEHTQLEEVEYYDGLTVYTGHYADDTRGWAFREIKYVDVTTKHPIRYDGRISLNKDDLAEIAMIKHDKTMGRSCLMDIASQRVTYNLGKNQIYRKELGTGGYVLRIESQPEGSFTSHDILECTKQPDGNYNYEMKVLVGSHNDRFHLIFEKIDKNKLNEKFMIFTTEVWECQPHREEGNSVALLRVHNTLTVKSGSVSLVIYGDGVTVSSDGKFIEEIKYIDPNNANKVVKFDGFLVFDEPFIQESEEIGGQKKTEIDYLLDEKLSWYQQAFKSQEGFALDIGNTWERELERKEYSFNCQLSEEVLPYPYYYIPKISAIQPNSFKKEIMKRDDFLEIFNVKMSQAIAHECESHLGVQLHKIINTFETDLDLSTIYYPDGVMVWNTNTKTDEGQVEKIWHIRETKYYELSTKKFVKYAGTLTNVYQNKKFDKYGEGTSVERTSPMSSTAYKKYQEKLVWYQDHQQWMKNKEGLEPLENIIYWPREFESIFIQPIHGLNIEVGSKFTREIGTIRDTFECEPDSSRYDTSKLLTCISLQMDNDRFTLQEDSIITYFDIIDRDILKCRKETDSFLRVVTKLHAKKGIRRVSYRDGIKIIVDPTEHVHRKSVTIIEKKYLDPKTLQVLKYVGKVVKKLT